MKKMVRILSLFLAVVLTLGILSGCGTDESTLENDKYTYWVSLSSAASSTIKSYNDLLMYQEMSKRTGIDVEFIHPSSGSTGTEAFQILLASGDYPDMVEYSWNSYPGGPDAAINDGVIISLNDYLEDYAPNYYSYMEGKKSKENPLYRVQTITQAGNYYGFKNLNIGSYRSFSGLYVRKDFLDKWGLDIPVTIDDWTELFKTAKKNGCSRPLTSGKDLLAVNGYNYFNSAWNVGKQFYVDNGKIQFGLEKPEYKLYLNQMAEWYKSGYIDVDYITNDGTVVQAYMTNGTSVASVGPVGGGMGKLLTAMETRDPNYDLAACPTPVLNEGDESWFTVGLQGDAIGPEIAITNACGEKDENRYKEAIKWCDYLYSDEGIILKSFGVEGETYETTTQSDGKIKYEYTISSPEVYEKFGATSVEAALYHFFRPANSPGFNQHDDYLDGYYPYAQQKEAIKLWNINAERSKKHTMPGLTYTGEEATKIAEIKAKYSDKLETAVYRVICGDDSMDQFDATVKEVKLGGYDELIKIYQAAYERYKKVLNQ